MYKFFLSILFFHFLFSCDGGNNNSQFVSNQNSPPAIVPLSPLQTQFGRTYAEWGTVWWERFYAHTATNHPVLDETGSNCGEDQNEAVFFLDGNLGGTTVRFCVAPANTAIFFPILNVTTDNAGVAPGDELSLDELIANAENFVLNVTNLFVFVNGQEISNLTEYRAGPEVFEYTVPDTDNIYQFFGLDVTGTISPSVSDGYWMMLPPLSPGNYEIRFGGTTGTPPDDFSVNITYYLSVQ